MTAIPLPTGIKGDEDTPQLQESLVNLFNDGEALIKTPGISSFSTGEGLCRGMIDFNDECYQVSAENLIKVKENGTTEIIGEIAGTAECVLAKTFNFLVIVVKGGPAYSLSMGGAFAEITSSNYRPSIDVDTINQRFIFVPEDGSPLFYTDVGTLDIQPLSFFDAELLPDRNTGCINLKNDFIVCGEESLETFRDIGDINSPFQRVNGAAVQTGYIAAKAIYKETFVFLGKDRGGSFGFHAKGSGVAPKISTIAIDEVLNNGYSVAELKECLSQRITWSGIDMVAFRLARDTFLFYGTGWTRIQTGITGDDTNQPWDVNYVTFSYGRYVTGSATSAKIGKLEQINTEFGERIERKITTYIRMAPNSYLTIDNFFLKCRTGTSSEAGSVGISLSHDGILYGPTVYKSSGPVGKYHQQMAWRGGCGIYESFVGIRIKTESDLTFALDGLFFNA